SYPESPKPYLARRERARPYPAPTHPPATRLQQAAHLHHNPELGSIAPRHRRVARGRVLVLQARADPTLAGFVWPPVRLRSVAETSRKPFHTLNRLNSDHSSGDSSFLRLVRYLEPRV